MHVAGLCCAIGCAAGVAFEISPDPEKKGKQKYQAAAGLWNFLGFDEPDKKDKHCLDRQLLRSKVGTGR